MGKCIGFNNRCASYLLFTYHHDERIHFLTLTLGY